MTTLTPDLVDTLAASLAERLGPLLASGDETLARRHAFAALARVFKDQGAPDDDSQLAALTRDLEQKEATVAQLEHELALARGLPLPEPAALARSLEYVARLRREAAEAQAPIARQELDRVEALLRSGQTDVARALGEALLGRSLARSQELFARAPVARLEERPAPAPTSAETEARLMRHRGWTVELSADRTRIERAAPPPRDRAGQPHS